MRHGAPLNTIWGEVWFPQARLHHHLQARKIKDTAKSVEEKNEKLDKHYVLFRKIWLLPSYCPLINEFEMIDTSWEKVAMNLMLMFKTR